MKNLTVHQKLEAYENIKRVQMFNRSRNHKRFIENQGVETFDRMLEEINPTIEKAKSYGFLHMWLDENKTLSSAF